MQLDVILWCALAGTLFSGYIAGHRLIVKQCPFNEECPEFLGRPACEYGLALFLFIFLTALSRKLGVLATFEALSMIYWVSLLGMVFSGYYIGREVLHWMQAREKKYGLTLPTCVYGFLGFVAVFTLCAIQ